MNDNLKKAHSAAHTPEANAKRAATMAALRAAGKFGKAKKTKKARKTKKVTSIPLHLIPDDPPPKRKGRLSIKDSTQADIVKNLSEALVLMLRIVNK